MPRRPAKVTQAEIARAIRAAQEAGAREVTVDSDGNIRIPLKPSATPNAPTKAIESADEDEREAWTPPDVLKRHLNSTESG